MTLRRWIFLTLVVLGLGGLLVAASGVVSIKASGGHFRVTAWMLHFAMQRSVATHTLGDAAPATAAWQVLKGAGHYELGCRPCHGRPNETPPPVALAMLPPPPTLGAATAEKWAPEELAYIVQHGVKFTGMPAWPTQRREDEVAAMVAFVLAARELDGAAYDRMVFAGAGAGLAGRACARCHGADGCGREDAAFPRIAGQPRQYLIEAMQGYVSGGRTSGVMQVAMARVAAEEVAALAEHYAGLPGCAAVGDASTEESRRGRALAEEASADMPSCGDCHGPTPSEREPAMPALAGQYAEYLVLQLELFKAGTRGGGSRAHLMDPVVERMTPAQMREVAAYYSSLPGSGATQTPGAGPRASR